MSSLLREIDELIDYVDSKRINMSESKSNDCGLSLDSISQYEKEFRSNPMNLLNMNTLSQSPTLDILLKRQNKINNTQVFNVKIPSEGKPVTSQASTGRCWLFAAMNVMRIPFMKEMELESFEFSQAYLYFWDKFERCNFFLEQIIDTVNEPLEGRLVQHLLDKPQEDGGQYDMIVNLVEKYGLVPKDVYPEIPCTKSSLVLRRLLNKKLREYACKIRSMALKDKKKVEEIRKIVKTEYMSTIYRLMALHFGIPPSKFSWAYYTKDKKYKEIKDIRPQDFYDKYVRKFVNVKNNYSIINDPRNKYYKLYTVDRLNNILNGERKQVLYINLPIKELKKYAIKMLKNGDPVWFGCHVSQEYHRGTGTMDYEQYDYKNYLGVEFNLNKSERLQYGESLMTHAMVFTAVHIDDDYDKNNKSYKWRVENSWGDKRGSKGYDFMSDRWFDEFNYQICVDKNILSQEIQDVLKQDPVVLPPWDPMGSLAGDKCECSKL